MNAPFRARDVAASAATLHLYAVFHLNLAFSSIEEDQRGEVIARCYWPLLELAQMHGPIGIESSGFTLDEIASRDPRWIARARELIGCGKIEFIGCGYAQLIGPLVPSRVTEENLKIGNTVYRHLLGVTPTLALVNEQAYSAGLVGLYLDAGYSAILMDWDNPASHHPEWPEDTRYRPQRAVGSDGRSIAVVWTSTVAFQKMQRVAHGDIALDDYVDFVRTRHGETDRALCLYASDAEIFDFRPGRYNTEEKIQGGEWNRLGEIFGSLASEDSCVLVAPSQVLALSNRGSKPLHLETAECPVPVKKQRKYSLARWAVTGRDDIAINAACQRIHDGLVVTDAGEDAWKELCYLWSSDFRTHITQKRWDGFCVKLHDMERRHTAPLSYREVKMQGISVERRCPSGAVPQPKFEGELQPPHEGEAIDARFIDIATPSLKAKLDRRRGLAIESLSWGGAPLIGGLRHGHFDDIALQADWYTGDCVFEAPGEHKITDLEWCEARIWKDASGDTTACARIDTPRGRIDKTMRFCADRPRVEFDIVFDWQDWGRGSLRLGHITLLPGAFDWAKLSLTTHNGGKESETFPLNGHAVDHGAAVSFLVSSSFGIGMTEGWAEVGDSRNRVRIDIDRATAPLLGLLTHRVAGGSLFCQLQLSALELDETRKPQAYKGGPRRFRFGVSLARS